MADPSQNSILTGIGSAAPTWMHEVVMSRMRSIFRDEQNKTNPVFATVNGMAGIEVFVTPDGESGVWRVPFLAGQRFAVGQRVLVVPTQTTGMQGIPVAVGIQPRSSSDLAVIGGESIIANSIATGHVINGAITGLKIAGAAIGTGHLDATVNAKFDTIQGSVNSLNSAVFGAGGLSSTVSALSGTVSGLSGTVSGLSVSVDNIGSRLGTRTDPNTADTAFGRAADAWSKGNHALGIAENARDRIVQDGGIIQRLNALEAGRPPPDPPSSGGGCCFPAGTLVTMWDRSLKPIERVVVGDRVLGHNGLSYVTGTVNGIEAPLRDHVYVLTFADGTTLRLTEEHPIFTREGWKSVSPDALQRERPGLAVGTLHIGDEVRRDDALDDLFVEIVDVDFVPGEVQTYNLSDVENGNTYFADGKLAHNKKKKKKNR